MSKFWRKHLVDKLLIFVKSHVLWLLSSFCCIDPYSRKELLAWSHLGLTATKSMFFFLSAVDIGGQFPVSCCCSDASWTAARSVILKLSLVVISLKFLVSFCKEKTVRLSSIFSFKMFNSISSGFILWKSEGSLATASSFVSHKTHWLSQWE